MDKNKPGVLYAVWNELDGDSDETERTTSEKVKIKQNGNSSCRDYKSRNQNAKSSSQCVHNPSSSHSGNRRKRVLAHQQKDLIQENKKFEETQMQGKRKIRPMSFLRLRDLTDKEPNEILLTINDKTSGFSLILEQDFVKHDIMAYVILALGKAVSSYLTSNVISIINSIACDSNFFQIHIRRYLTTFHQKCKTERYHLISLDSFCEFLRHYQLTLPSTASEELLMLLPFLEKTCRTVLSKDDVLLSIILTKINKIEEANEFFLKDYTPNENRQVSYEEKLHLQNPPENYRSIPTLPTTNDIHEPCSFLRPNLVKGQYLDTEHYLDVQYRLLREDYVKPLRDGVSEYLLLLKQNKPLKSLRDVRVYTDVHIVKQEFVKGGLVHIAFFDEKKFSNIKWEFSKRFLSGSLLCLSDDDFKTMLFASVAVRNPKELAKGKLLLRFEELTDEILNLNPLRSFVVIETNAYFEAYRYNLNALHDLNEDKLPMKQYIVNVQKNVRKPQYLKEVDTYDLRPLLMPLDDNNVKHHADAKGKIITSYEFPVNISLKATSIPVLEDGRWPTSSELNMDPSQHAAIKAAVTKEFAVIQGPPGTGKTYVGLRIVQLLLHNKIKWQAEGESSPILVVCFTNHALDQFLEGLLLFTQRIVRVGGRGSNEALTPFQLNNLKRVIKEKREVPNYIFKNIKQKNFELRRLKDDIDEIKTDVERCYLSVLDEHLLKGHMNPGHYTSLVRINSQVRDRGCVMHYWLNVRIKTGKELGNMDPEKLPDDYLELNKADIKCIEGHIRNCLNNSLAMSEEENETVQNPWALPLLDRWRLYKFWLESYVEGKGWDEIDEIKTEVGYYLSALDENLLKDHMHPRHYTSLVMASSQVRDVRRVIHYWLNIRIRNGDELVNADLEKLAVDDLEFDNAVSTDHNPNLVDALGNVEDVESEEEADIEYIEAQRDINSEEFADVSFDIPLYQNKIEFDTADDDGWQIQGGQKEIKKYIKNCLNKSQPMSEEETKTVQDLWELPLLDRWRLYKFWLESYVKEKNRSTFHLQMQFKNQFQELCEMRSEEDLYVCRQAHVIGMTTTGAAKYRDILQHLNPKIVIVEEAAEILESHIVTSLSPGTQHVILIGDHQQLRPSPTVHSLAVKFGLNISLFERMIKNGMECYKLGLQHRMRPEIAALLVPHIYSELKNHESVTKFENIKGVNKNVFFVTHNFSELQEFDSKSKVNQHEAKFLIKLCRYIVLQGYKSSQITVLTTYSGQLFALKKLMGKGVLQGVKFTVVDNYQGEENDIILISFVRSNEEGQIGFLKISNRVCVALSRARKGLFCIGNFELLAEKSDLWKGIVGALHQRQAIGPSLQLQCQNHPGVSSVVACEKDFDSVPEGGCTRNCDFRLLCGHVCSSVCHPNNMEHLNIRCHKPCNKSCKYGHKCKRICFEKCEPCTEMVSKRIELCGHIVKVQCHKQNTSGVCTKPCERVLPCGHTCSKLCSLPCVIQCMEMISIQSPICGHRLHIKCCNSEDEISLLKKCTAPCAAELSCGHMCRGKCNSCHQGRLHVACNQPCKRVLVCGHECKSPCSKSCPPCKRLCENRCIHSRCPKMCGEPCDKCSEPCEWLCVHKQCEYTCGEICSRGPCNEPCRKLLKCKHECIGLCGEPCPEACRICNKELVEDIFFGSEDEIDARFVCLEDCGHVFEMDGISQWMKLDNQERRHIQMKACPKCKTVIRKNLHFGNVVKSCLKEIEKVKAITFGDTEHNLVLQKRLLNKVSKKSELRLQPILNVLKSSKCRSIQEITVMENVINISTLLEESTTCVDTLTCTRSNFIDPEVQRSYSKLKTYAKTTKRGITEFIQDEYLTASDQQLQDVTWEVHRLKLADQLLQFLDKITTLKPNTSLSNLMRCIVTHSPFRDTDAEKFVTEFGNLRKLVGLSVINVSELEKTNILKAMGLSQGHWFQCPNGHVYCITECGGAMVESKCNECGEKIGGTSHRLLGTNRLATAMDGSRHPAWPSGRDMRNNDF